MFSGFHFMCQRCFLKQVNIQCTWCGGWDQPFLVLLGKKFAQGRFQIVEKGITKQIHNFTFLSVNSTCLNISSQSNPNKGSITIYFILRKWYYKVFVTNPAAMLNLHNKSEISTISDVFCSVLLMQLQIIIKVRYISKVIC